MKGEYIINLTHVVKKHGGYIQTLFDPQQTHAVYGCTQDSLDKLKLTLKYLGANKFRLVKNNGFPILCFNASKMNFIN